MSVNNKLQAPPRRNKNRIHKSPVRAAPTTNEQQQQQIPVTKRFEDFPHCGEKGTATREGNDTSYTKLQLVQATIVIYLAGSLEAKISRRTSTHGCALSSSRDGAGSSTTSAGSRSSPPRRDPPSSWGRPTATIRARNCSTHAM